LQVDVNGNIAYNDIPVVQNGVYIGDNTWGTKLAALKTQPSSINRIELVIGGQGNPSFTNIKTLIASQGMGSGSILYKNFKALKNATGIDAIQCDDEQTYDVPSAVAFGHIIANLGMKVTLCPYTAQNFWASVKSQLGTNVDSIYLQCYKGGAHNDPASWISAFDGFKVYPGLWRDAETPVSVIRKMRNWQQTLGINGGFMWLNGNMPEDAAKWAGTLLYGLAPIPDFRIVNKGSGKSLDLVDGSTINGSSISQSGDGGGNNGRWMLVPTEDGAHFKIVSWVSGQSVSIANDSSMVGAQIWNWDYNNDPSQQFDLVNVDNGWFKIKNVRSRLVLEVAGSSTVDYVPVQQNIDTGAANQRWKFYPCQDAMLAYDDFDYPVRDLSGQRGGEGWSDNWSDDLGPATKVSAGSLVGETNVPTDYNAQSLGNSAFIPNGGRVGRYLDCSVNGPFSICGYLNPIGRIGADGTTLYISFLQQPAKTAMFYEFELDREHECVASIGNDTSTNNVNLRVPALSFTTIGPGSTNVNFYVMRIDFKRGYNVVRVYHNPTSITEPATSTATLTNCGDMSFNRISLAAFANSNMMRFDQIRIANSWRYAIRAAPQFITQPSGTIDSDDIFRRVRISAQVVCGRGQSYYLIDGSTGLHVVLNHPLQLEAGDTVYVTGLVFSLNQFVDLIEATAYKTGHLPLAKPRSLNLIGSDGRTAWVWTEGILTGSKDSGTERILEMQSGLKSFVARLSLKNQSTANWPIGSRLKITGFYVPNISPQIGLENESSFEIRLNSPSAVEILARPPWWTLRQLMIVVGLLITGLALTFTWISSLRRQVERQTIRLNREIVQRCKADRARLIEEERSRISQDLHDDLGSKLTQISILAWLPKEKATSDLAKERLQLIGEKSRRMASTLDEVVWMMNSKNDTLSSFTAYLAAYAEEYLSKTDITCRVETPGPCPEKIIISETRNNLFFAVKEAINNAVRHGNPTKISLKIAVSADNLIIHINDNGCGYDSHSSHRGMGIGNIQDRMLKLNGLCHIQSSVQGGTTITLQVPLDYNQP
jgi:signal transduction histidine kinase